MLKELESGILEFYPATLSHLKKVLAVREKENREREKRIAESKKHDEARRKGGLDGQ